MEQHLLRAMAVVREFVQARGELESTLREITEVATDALGASMAGSVPRCDAASIALSIEGRPSPRR